MPLRVASRAAQSPLEAQDGLIGLDASLLQVARYHARDMRAATTGDFHEITGSEVFETGIVKRAHGNEE